MNSDGSGSSRMRDDDEQSIASTAGPPPDSPPITGRFNSTSWAHMGESCPSGGSSLTNSFSVQFHSGQNNNFRPSLQRMNSSIFLYSGYHPSQSVASISASPTMNGSPGREWGRSFIVRPTSSSVQGRGYRSAFGGTIRNGVELERSTFLPQRQGSPCSTQYGWGFASQEACRASLVFSSTSPGFTAPGSPLHSPAASYYYGHTQRAKVSPAVAVARFAMGGSTWLSPASKDLPSSLSALKNYIAVNGKTIIVGDESHPLEIKRGGVLGSGGFAKVFIGLDTVKGELLAIKEMSTENITDVHTLNEIEQEFALLRSIRHPNVINYHFFEHSKSQKVCRIAMELLAGNSTMHLLQRFGPLTETILRKITRHLLNAISFVHKEGIFHRDIKPANILVSHTGNVKLCDFGCSKRVSELSKASSCIIGTPIYMAPELIKRTPHQKSDIWSMGCTLFELATGLQPWYHTGVKAYIPLTFYITTTSESPLVLPEEDHLTEFSPEFLNFLNLCFCRDVQKRPEATELLRHPWITEKKMIPAQRLSPELSQPGSPHSYNPNDTKMSESSPDESKYEDELTHEEDERRAETETMCQQELEDVCATIALDRCYQLMNYRYPPAVEFKAADGVSETTRTSCSTPTPSLGKPMTNSIFDFAGGEGSPEQSLLNDDFVFQHAPLGISAGNFVLPTEISETPMQQCLRINENGKLEFANLPEEEGDVGEMANFRSISVDSNVFSRSHNSRFVSPGRKASLHGNNGATQMPTESPHGSSYVSRGSSPYRGQGDGQSGGRNSGSPSPPPFFTQGSTSSRSGQQPYGSIRDDFNQASAPHSPFPVSAKKLPDSSQVDGKLYTSFCVNAASGHEVNVELEVDMNDVHLRMVNNQPNYLVAFNENIKSQITNKLKEVAAQADADHLESARSSSKRYNGQPGSIDGSHRHPSPISTRRTSQNLSFYSNDARSRENVGSEADAPVRSSVSPQRKMPPSILTQRLPSQRRSPRKRVLAPGAGSSGMDSLVAGAFAGLVVDLTLYPIDTIKTRIQSKEGFWASGGVRNIYKGLSAVAIGSIPGGAAFFFAYDTTKTSLFRCLDPDYRPSKDVPTGVTAIAVQSVAASIGECAACCIRVPTEMVKQQLQAGKHHSARRALHCITNNVGPESENCGKMNWRGLRYLFRGMPIMLWREIPFSVVQMSLYEGFKRYTFTNEATRPYYYTLLPICGAVAGGTAAFFTTPLDVIKTRIMLQHHLSFRGIRHVVHDIASEPCRPNDIFGTPQKFFRGASARVFWISAGGSIFFSAYEFCKLCVNRL